jgi:hypothetical protein
LGGSVLGALLAATFLVFDLAVPRTLILSSDNATMALVMMFGASASTFATATTADAIMMLAASDDDHDFHERGTRQYVTVPVRCKRDFTAP